MNKNYLILILSVVYFSSVILATGGNDPFWNSIALGGMMVLLWFFEAVPIYVTALLPIALSLPLKVLDIDQLAKAYGNEYVHLFLGGFILALAMEKWDVHKQIAKGIIRFIGTSKSGLILGFLLSTGILSMWISNTATALMMLPMATAITHNLPKSKSKFTAYLLLAVAYGSSIGGMATLIGSPANTMMAGTVKESFGIEVSFFEWMKIGVPVSIVMMIVTFLFFHIRMGKERKQHVKLVDEKKEPWTKNQFKVIALFSIVVLLWSFREYLSDWTGIKYKDQGVAILGAILLFVIPASDKKSLLEWKDTKNLSWGILLLFGGGFALAEMLKVNGVIISLTELFQSFQGSGMLVILILLVVIAIFGTEVISNTALVAVFTPVVAEIALNSGLPVLQLCMPIALASSCAFMLPVGTPPNAIVFSSGQLTINQMAKTGFVLNLVGVIVVVTVTMLLLG